jgi:hypothetical protein
VLVLAVVGYMANPSVNQAVEATIGTAQRHRRRRSRRRTSRWATRACRRCC